jgi:choline-sulfatase/uncharacterized sulfatase
LLDDRDDHLLPEWHATGGGGQGLDARPSRLPYAHCVEHWVAAHAVDFLRTRPKDRPFFLWASFPRPHQVFTPSREFWDLYDEARLTLPPNADDSLADKPPHVRAMLRQREGTWQWVFEPRDWAHGFRRALRGYLACVTQVDHAAGEVLDALDALGLREDTLVVFSADHGGFAGDHGIVEKAPGVGFEAITRVPFIWSLRQSAGRAAADGSRDSTRSQRVAPGHVCDALVESVDFLPTVCRLAGLPAPAMCDGRDVTPLLAGGNEPVRDTSFTENVWSKRIRTDRWSFVHYQPEMFARLLPAAGPAQDAGPEPPPVVDSGSGEGEGEGELYDLQADPWELRNRYHDPACAGIVHRLRRRVLEWLVGTQHPATMLPMPLDLWQLDARGAAAGAPAYPLPEDGRVPPARIRRFVREGGGRNYL